MQFNSFLVASFYVVFVSASPALSQVPVLIPYEGEIFFSQSDRNIVRRSDPFTVSSIRDFGSVTITASDVNGGTVLTTGFTSGQFLSGFAGLSDTIVFTAPPGATARVRLTALGQLAVTGSGNASASLGVFDLDQGLEVFSGTTFLNSNGGSQFRTVRFNPTFTMPANSSFAFQLGVRGTADGGPGSFFAYFDPVISFGAVPEPGSWAMLIAGFGLVGATIRRRSSPYRLSRRQLCHSQPIGLS